MQVFLPNPDYDYTEYVAGVEPYVCTAPADTAEMRDEDHGRGET